MAYEYVYFDTDGKPCTVEQMEKLMRTEQIVQQTLLPNGLWVSTVYLGINYSYGSHPPAIFETMVFKGKGDYSDLYCQRYSTKSEALVGHADIVKKWNTLCNTCTAIASLGERKRKITEEVLGKCEICGTILE